jgi:hypothetical protein
MSTGKATTMKRSNQETSMEAVKAVAFELGRRGYVVEAENGDAPKVHLRTSATSGQQFRIQVRGCSRTNPVNIGEDFLDVPERQDLFLIVVLLPPPGSDVAPRFFLLSQPEAAEEWRRLPNNKPDGSTYDPSWFYSLSWRCIEPYEGKWEKLPK